VIVHAIFYVGCVVSKLQVNVSPDGPAPLHVADSTNGRDYATVLRLSVVVVVVCDVMYCG